MSWIASNLPAQKHCFFGAKGGVSTGVYAGLNVNTKSDDDKAHLAENLQRAAAHFGLNKDRLLLLNQGVSAEVAYVTEPSQDVIRADGAVTDKENIILCIRTADCAPVLLADYAHGVIGAAHAGWRGAFAGVIENTVQEMMKKGAVLGCIAAAVGPCIGQKSYEVDDNFYSQIARPEYFIPGRPGHWQFDLQAYCVDKLKSCGITNVCASGIDTCGDAENYYSFRRFTLQGLVRKPKCFPTEMSAIVL